MKLYQKLHEIQKHVIGLGKNKKADKYEYVTGSKVLEHIKPKMNELGLILKQELLSITNERQDYATQYGTRSEILSTCLMRFTWIDVETGDKDENLFGANGQNNWDKGVGSALTYAERYFLLKYFHIATDEDDIDGLERAEAIAPTKKPKFTQNAAFEHLGKKTSIADIRAIYEITQEQEAKYLKALKNESSN